jgi:DnaJ-class molecular chaperone
MKKRLNKIVNCPDCQGYGKVNVQYWKSTKEPHTEDCTTCHGTGRLLRVVEITHLSLIQNANLLKTVTRED